MHVWWCFFETLLKACNFSSFQLSTEPAEHCADSRSDRPERKRTEPLVATGSPRARSCTQTHTGLQDEGLQDGPALCNHTMPFLQIWFHIFLVLVSDQEKRARQPPCLRREPLISVRISQGTDPHEAQPLSMGVGTAHQRDCGICLL